jgi:hypothetical protein
MNAPFTTDEFYDEIRSIIQRYERYEIDGTTALMEIQFTVALVAIPEGPRC